MALGLTLVSQALTLPQRGAQGMGGRQGGRGGFFAPVSDRIGGDSRGKRTRVTRKRGPANKSAMADLQVLLRGGAGAPAPSLLPVARAAAPGGDRLLRETDFTGDEQVNSWFETCDTDATGWLAFREVEAALDFDRPRFRAFDADRDGRLALSEFQDYYRHQFTVAGGVRPPRVESRLELAPPRRSRQLRLAYDLDANQVLDEAELTQVLEGYGRFDLETDAVFDEADLDRSGSLDESELESVADMLAGVTGEGGSTLPVAAVRSVDLLFGAPIGPDVHTSSLPRVEGPITPFRRLDLDGDGLITLADLESLQRPLRSSIRIGPILLALDANGDGGLDQAELRAAMGDIR